MTVDATSVAGLNPNIAWLLWRTARRAGSARAVTERSSAVSYMELLNRATAIAESLASHGVSPGDRVAILLERGADAAAAYFAALATGAIAVVATETLKSRQIDHILAHSGARFVLTAGEFLA